MRHQYHIAARYNAAAARPVASGDIPALDRAELSPLPALSVWDDPVLDEDSIVVFIAVDIVEDFSTDIGWLVVWLDFVVEEVMVQPVALNSSS